MGGDYSKVIALDPKYAIAYINRGIVYHGKGEYDLAIVEYNRAFEPGKSIALDPKYTAVAYNGRGSAYEASTTARSPTSPDPRRGRGRRRRIALAALALTRIDPLLLRGMGSFDLAILVFAGA
jgi:tetratricopeptide (TPR) repeat protein